VAFKFKSLVRALAVSMGVCGATAAWAADNSFIPTLDCSTKPSAFNTGYNQSTKVQLAPGSTDPQWYVYPSWSGVVKPTNALPANSDSGWVPAYVPTAIAPAWVPSRNPGAVLVDGSGNPDADWISPRVDGTTFGGGRALAPITVYYRTQFILAPSVDPANVQIKLDRYSDDEGYGVFINGTYTALAESGFNSGSMKTDVLSGPWQTGLNTVVFALNDQGWMSGLLERADPTATSICKVLPQTNAVPTLHPTILLSLVGLLGLLGRRFLRSRA